MKPTVIITAAGNSTRWNNHLDTFKHLAPVDQVGQTIIGRTIKMLKNSGVDNIFVVTRHDKIIDSIPEYAKVITPLKSDSLAESILSSCKKWTDRTIVLLGDVYFSRKCLNTILACKKKIKFFGINRPVKPELCEFKRSELYAYSFDVSAQDIIEHFLTLNSTLAHFRDHGGLRLPYLRIGLAKKLDCLKLLFQYSNPPKPPRLFMEMGFKRSLFWKMARFLLSKPKRKKIYGKLWGLYYTTAGIDLFESTDYKPLLCDNNYLKEIDDITQDVDTKEDYELLLEKLIQNEHG